MKTTVNNTMKSYIGTKHCRRITAIVVIIKVIKL